MTIIHSRLYMVVLSLLFHVVPVFAKPIDLVIVRDESEHSLAHCNIIQMAEYAEGYFQQYGINLRFTAYHDIKLSTRPQLYQAENALYKYGRFAKQHDFLRRFRLVHFVSGPLFQDDRTFISYYSKSTCGVRRKNSAYSYSSAAYENQDGEPRLKQSLTALLHEVGHYLGAEHDDSEPVTLMNSAPLDDVDRIGVPELSQKSLKQIYECVHG